MDRFCLDIVIELPKGACDGVDAFGIEIVKKFGKDKLNEIAKLNFKNTERILK
jgi:ribonuclease HIII